MTFPARVVNGADRGHEANFVAAFAQAPAQVDVFIVQKITFIEAMQFAKNGSAKQHEHSRYPVGGKHSLSDLVVETCCESEEFAHEKTDRRKMACAAVLVVNFAAVPDFHQIHCNRAIV